MAIIQGLPGLEVTIFTNGCTAKEYDDPSGAEGTHQTPRVVTKYIECKDNEPFRIHLKATDEYWWGFKHHVLNFGAVIDGIWAKGEICRQEYTDEEDWEREISYRVVRSPNDYSRYILQEFAFLSIIKAEDATDKQHESDVEKMERLGTIEVKVHRATVQANGPIFVPSGNHPEDFTMSREVVKGKAKSHGTKFTRTQPAVKPKYIRCLTLTEDDGPIAIFRFKYRSREALILGGVTPDPRKPSDWLVEISDDEKDGDQRRNNTKFNMRSAPNLLQPAETKIEKEKEDDRGNIALPPPSSTTSQNINIKPAIHKDSSDRQARHDAITKRVLEIIKPQVKQGTGGSVNGTPSVSKSLPSRDSDVALVQKARTLFGSRSHEAVLPSIESVPHAIRVKIKFGEKATSKNDKTATQWTIKLNKKHPTSTPSTVNEIRGHQPKLSTYNSTLRRIEMSSEAKGERRGPIKLNEEERKLKIRHLKRLRAERDRYLLHLARLRSAAAPTPSSLPPPAHTTRATNLLKTMLPPPPPSLYMNSHASTSDNTKPTVPSRVFPSPLGDNPSKQADRVPITLNKPVSDSTSSTIADSHTANANVSAVIATPPDKETKTTLEVAPPKRKVSGSMGILTDRFIYRSRPFKKPKTQNDHRIVELSDSS